MSLIDRAAMVFPELNTLGWDVAVTNMGLYILEANSRYDIDLNQITLNRGIRPEIKRFLPVYP
jgi:hypothetical protein